MSALPQPVPDDHPSSSGLPGAASYAEDRTPAAGPAFIGPAPVIDLAAASTAAFVLNDHAVGWHDIEDTVTVYRWILDGLDGLPPGLTVYPTATQAAAFLHGHRARQERDVPCDWCVSDLRLPVRDVTVDECAVATTRYVFAGHSPKGSEALEMLLVYLWVVATARPSYAGDGGRTYDSGLGASRFLHSWRAEQGLEEPDSCVICP